MALTKEQQETRLKMHIGRAYRLYIKDGKSPEEIAMILRRPVSQIEKWINNFKIIDEKRRIQNG